MIAQVAGPLLSHIMWALLKLLVPPDIDFVVYAEL